MNKESGVKMSNFDMEKLMLLSKQYGFVYQGSEIYGGLANTWDYGPLGIEVKKNIKNLWWKRYIQETSNSFGIDSAILMNPRVWEASGHINSFNDPLMDCKSCKTRHRADNLIETFTKGEVTGDGMSNEELMEFITKEQIKCPKCGEFNYTDIRQFNLMFKTHRGVTDDSKSEIHLRPETAQGQFVNFANIQRSQRSKLPFGVGQIGKAFRNEITPGNFIFRTIEFEQMEYQFFCKPGTDDTHYDFYKQFALDFFTDLGIDKDNLRYKDHEKLAHYAKAATDIEYKFPFGWGEINGTHNRTDFDLKQHQTHSKTNLEYLEQETNEKFLPYVIESTIGADRAFLTVICDAYCLDGDREILKFHPAVAPYKVAILPLIKKYHSEKAQELLQKFSKYFMTTYDESGKIGKRYRRQDIIGTPFSITIDDDSLNEGTVTIRDRDTAEQIKLTVEEAITYVENKIRF